MAESCASIDQGIAAPKLRILRLDMSMDQTSGPYMQFSLPVADRHTITVLTYETPAEQISPAIEFHSCGSSMSAYFRALLGILKTREFDVVHAHSVHVACAFVVAKLALLFKRRVPPAVLTMHCSWPNLKLRNRLFALLPFIFFDKIVFCSEASKGSFPFFIKLLIGRRGQAICNGVDIERLDKVLEQKSSAAQARRHYFHVVTVGRLVPVKDQLTLLRAFAALREPNSKLTIVGSGPCKEELLREVAALGLGGRIEMIDFMTRAEVYQLLSQCDLFLSTSLTEGMPIAPLEALLCGCPAVLSDIPAHKEILGGDGHFDLVECGDPSGFAGAMRKFKHRSADEKSRLKEIARQLVETRFGLIPMLNSYDAVFSKLAARRREEVR